MTDRAILLTIQREWANRILNGKRESLKTYNNIIYYFDL